MATADPVDTHDSHHDDHHDDHHGPHPDGEFIAHHFESAEQQYDSGKLGIWLFLVTEVLFFGGLFCAYTVYRVHHPEIFIYASTFLDTTLGALNTLVLLFSSLTMAWAVRCAQLGNNKGVALATAITMICATIFLGVKAVEYTHKWDEGIYVAGSFSYGEHEGEAGDAEHSSHESGGIHLSKKLIFCSIPFAILLVGFAVGAIIAKGTGAKVAASFCGILALTFLGYFGGVGVGLVHPIIKEGLIPTEQEEAVGMLEHDEQEEADHHDGDHAGEDTHVDSDNDQAGIDEADDLEPETEESRTAAISDEVKENQELRLALASDEMPRDVGIFFSIYYCMTGLHAIHILAGIAALAWILYRSLLAQWRANYFGPVDYVGLYWHLVDLIWIFLFPLLYLIG